jgi:phage N-6-adenine-methyltransferase
MTAAQLFDVTADDVALTTDDWYTPRWLFRAAGLIFDLDVAAPVDPAFRTCPARQYLTVIENGLASEWHGIVWMNPPYSNPAPWVARWAQHDAGGLALLPAASSAWLGILLAAADALTTIRCNFMRPDGTTQNGAGRAALMLASRGPLATDALCKIAAADKHARGAYLVRPFERAEVERHRDEQAARAGTT